MKDGKNLWLLAVRAVIWKVLILLAALTAAETAFYLWKRNAEYWELADFFGHGAFWAVWALAVLAMGALLGTCLTGRKGGGCGLVLRLGLTRKQRLLWMLLLSGGCWVALWGWQTALGWLFCRGLAAWGDFSSQAAFFTFYQSSFLHSLMPLADGLRWIGTAGGFAGAALGGAAAAVGRWEGRQSLGSLVSPAWMLLLSMPNNIIAVLAGVVGAACGWMAFKDLWKEELP